MNWLLLMLLFLILLLILIMFSKASVHIDFYHGNDNDHLKVVVRALGGLITLRKEIPMIKVDEDSPSVVISEETKTGPNETTKAQGERSFDKADLLDSLDDIKALIEHVVGLHTHVRKLLAKVKIKKLEWHTNVGIGDAASTAIACGAIWSVKGGILAILSHYMRLVASPVVTVTPNFQRSTSQILLKCMFQITMGHAIWAGIKLVKYWKGGMPEFKTKPLAVLSNNNANSI
ncbi:hypothetical protein WQ57_09260 [Mesobacillus campisalis]|uniref:Sporulation protein n=1 Tax=Mesobacillus campisalis TaxID=1408103 RepID=A0A0M2SZF9_9BACI|nr:DUF2953 domain-containing protein [Mesobacillus campisalis]KKK38367.1 hypothetical protein WQ57_09260 [Mesobacillus campisalis]